MVDFNKRVTANADDGRSRTNGVGFSTTYQNGLLGYDGFGYYHNFGRITGVTIPSGATIQSAVIRFTADNNYSGTGDRTKIHFENADNPSAPTSWSDLNGRSLTSGVDWDDVGNWTQNVEYDTPDLKDILQTVIDRGGWNSGQAIQFHLIDDGTSGSTNYRYRSHNNDSAKAPQLRVTYTVDPKPSVNESVGLEENLSVELEVLIEPSAADDIGLTENIQLEIDEITQFIIHEGLGVAENIQAELEILPEAQATEQIGLSESIQAELEILAEAQATETIGIAESITVVMPVAPVNPSAADDIDIIESIQVALDIPTNWIALANAGLAIERYHFTLTGDADSTTDVEIQFESLQSRKRTGESTYLSVVLRDYETNAPLVSARPNGTMIVEMNYEYQGESSIRQEIIRADLSVIDLYEGPENKSIQLTGYQTKTFANRSVELFNPTFRSTVSGRRTFRFARIDPYLNPGDTLVVGAVSMTVDYIVYLINPNNKTMEVRET